MAASACSPSYSGGWGKRIAWTQEAEVAVSRDCATALLPGQQEQITLSQKKKKRKKEKKKTKGNSKNIYFLKWHFKDLKTFFSI